MLLRLLLAQKPAQSELSGGETQHQRQETPGRSGGAEGLVEEIEELAASRNHRHPQAQAARLLELRWRHRQLRANLELHLVCEEARLQVAQPAQPAQKLHRRVLRGRVGALANAGSAGEREAVAKNR